MKMKKRTKTKKATRMKTTNRSLVALVWLALTLLGVTTVSADDKKVTAGKPYALIFGTVYGPSNHPAPGVKIKMRREGDKKSVELVTENNGEFAHRFHAGKAEYLVWADLKDKQAAQKTEVKVHIEKDERQDITLHLK